MKLFLDLDGVFADFDTHYESLIGPKSSRMVNWNAVHSHRTFFYDLPMMKDGYVLWNFVRHFNPTVLTGIPLDYQEEVSRQKKEWVAKYLSPDVPVITCMSAQKSDYADASSVIIDDWPRYQDRWEAKGGKWILHTSAEKSIADLISHLVK